jgi:hypothetical protein
MILRSKRQTSNIKNRESQIPAPAGNARSGISAAFRPRRLYTLILLFDLLVLCGSGSAVELWSDEEGHSGTLRITGKMTSLTSNLPDDPLLFSEDWSQTALARLRLGLEIEHSDTMNSEFAYEQRARWTSTGAGIGAVGGFLPSEARVPFRLASLDWEIAGDDDFAWRHDIDRALVALHPQPPKEDTPANPAGWGEITIGRQAIGLGRGVLFSAVDMFAPFSPLEVDREWRPGVDALRVEYRLSGTSSTELLAVGGESWEQSALLGHVRGYVGDVDGSLIFGKRAEDLMVGGVVSATVQGAEVHGELAVFDTPEAWPDTLWGNDHLVTKTVVGGSYTFNIENGLTVLAEHHYSGFGVENIEDALTWLQDPDYRQRFLRGDTQILGRQAIAVQLSYPFNDALSGSLLVLTSPLDGSGVASPTLRLDMTDNVTLIGSLFLPWGQGPSGGRLESEYGATPTSLFLQVSMYY